ncbi:hypothetical protein [Cyclobacterium roseum]|uniref:hypothetical protein n=1 Tax=Cyclobacterium roseum TaxID=2666137 RepID=UPI001390EF30|nr:hypothetical protein [Cyclobacterium roseum]
MKEIVFFLTRMVYTVEGKHMKKKETAALLQRLVQNKISREEFEELLSGMEDQETVGYLEESMKAYFDKIMDDYEAENRTNIEKKIPMTKVINSSN